MKRKTFNVEILKKRINRLIANDCSSPDAKRWLGAILSGILMDTGNYRGFNHNLPADMPGLETPEGKAQYDVWSEKEENKWNVRYY